LEFGKKARTSYGILVEAGELNPRKKDRTGKKMRKNRTLRIPDSPSIPFGDWRFGHSVPKAVPSAFIEVS